VGGGGSNSNQIWEREKSLKSRFREGLERRGVGSGGVKCPKGRINVVAGRSSRATVKDRFSMEAKGGSYL